MFTVPRSPEPSAQKMGRAARKPGAGRTPSKITLQMESSGRAETTVNRNPLNLKGSGVTHQQC